MTSGHPDNVTIDRSIATAVDFSGHKGVGLMIDLVENMSRAHDPQDVLRVFAEGFRRVRSFNAYLSLSTRGLAAGEYKITRFLSEFADGNL